MSVTFDDPTVLGSAHVGTSEALRRLAVRRDGEAWSAILQRHGADILRMAQRITGDSALCEDICQEALLQIRTYAGRFQPPENHDEAEAAAKGWVMCIAYRTALGMLRLRQRRNQNETQAGLEQRAQMPAMEDPLLTSEQLATLRREVAELPDLMRSAVCLHYYGQMSFPELSAALECSEKAARKRVERGVKRLRERLAAGGLAVGVGSLMLTLGGPAHAAGAAASGTVSNLVAIQSLAKWQALLHSPTVPALSGVAKIGGLVIMTKYVVGVAAVLALSLSTVQSFQLNRLSRQLNEKSAGAAALQNKVESLEKQLAENRGDTSALKAGLAARNEDVARLEKSVAQNPAAWNPAVPTLNAPGAAIAWTDTTPQTMNGTAVLSYRKALTNGAPDAQAFTRQLPPGVTPQKDTVIKILDDGTIQYSTIDGKILGQLRQAPDAFKADQQYVRGMAGVGGGAMGSGRAPGAEGATAATPPPQALGGFVQDVQRIFGAGGPPAAMPGAGLPPPQQVPTNIATIVVPFPPTPQVAPPQTPTLKPATPVQPPRPPADNDPF